MKLEGNVRNFCLRKRKTIIFILSIFFLSSCVSSPGTTTRNVHFQDSPGVDTLLIPAEYREVYFNNGQIGDKHCRAPGPDFTVQASDGVSVGGGVAGTTESAGVSSGESALTLGGRSAEVLLARELLYRACELSLNIGANGIQSTAIYYRFLDAVVQLSKHQSTLQTSSATDHTNTAAPVVDAHPSIAGGSGSGSQGSGSQGSGSQGSGSQGSGSQGSGSEYANPQSTLGPND